MKKGGKTVKGQMPRPEDFDKAWAEFKKKSRKPPDMRAKMNWIRVEDRLPDRTGLFLIYFPTLDKNSPFIGTAWYELDDQCWSLLPRVFCEAVTHWMPLPEPPQDQ